MFHLFNWVQGSASEWGVIKKADQEVAGDDNLEVNFQFKLLHF